MLIERISLQRYGRLLLAGVVVALRHSALERNWGKYFGLKSQLQHHKNFLISQLLRTKKLQKPIVANTTHTVSSKTIPLAFIASFSLFSASGSKKASKEQEPDTKMAEEAAKNLAETIQHSDQLFDENNFQDAYDLLQKCKQPELYDIKWRLARVVFNLSKSAPSPKKEEMIREAFQFATEALALDENDYASHKWYSILLDAKSGLDGIKERISQLENVKKHMLKAVELNPGDATSWYILGQFYYGLADLPWYQRKIVSTIFAAPPSGSYEEALECFEKAESTKPNFYSMNHLMLGKACQALKKTDKAKEYLTQAANVTVLNEDDKQAKEEATKLLKKL
ncbi:regulator of microtubule dynamics protein 1-like [Toxorhynchites rutilus septentrionalis]|uniref:regulator of microtubule dynamics protein 1-like n=1 Tax=Toxorhynchites rutilus septentrionalis TaxID=329112 RepID=UPI0024790F89|nr:regulator of microtubule dynamics protein 1-like [Toxorhynchites rutilus septentrionalis]